ncbi:MAG TPA: phosphotransferase [Mycobacteriales bacterium]|nr:phosphotransferase [Mycobacteriales bacterium]
MDVDAAVALVRERRPDLDLTHAELTSPGWDYDVLITDEWVVRFPRRRDVGVKLVRELSLLPALRPRLPVAIPKVELRGVLPEGETQWAGYRRIPGDPVTADLLTSARGGVARSQIAGVLEALADVPVREAVDIGLPAVDEGSWWAAQDGFVARVRDRVVPLLDAPGRSYAEAALAAYAELPRAFTPRLLHGDFHRGHLLCDHERGTITGVIDWSGAQIGDPALEAAQLADELPPDLVAALLPDYDDPHLWDRARCYQRFFPLEEALHGLTVNDARLLERGLRNATVAPS